MYTVEIKKQNIKFKLCKYKFLIFTKVLYHYKGFICNFGGKFNFK